MPGKSITIYEALNLGMKKKVPILQSIIFDKHMYDKPDILKWLKLAGFKHSLHETRNMMRARQMHSILGAKYWFEEKFPGILFLYMRMH